MFWSVEQGPTTKLRSMVTTHAPLAVQNGWVKKAGSRLEPTVTWHADFISFCHSELVRSCQIYVSDFSLKSSNVTFVQFYSSDSSIAAQLRIAMLPFLPPIHSAGSQGLFSGFQVRVLNLGRGQDVMATLKSPSQTMAP
eukprot:s1104_g3.t1